MRRVYRILGINVALETEFDFPTSENMQSFEVDENTQADERYIFHIVSEPVETRGELVSDSHIFKVRRDGAKTYYEHYFWDDRPPFVQLVSDGEIPGVTHCYHINPKHFDEYSSGTLFYQIPLEQILAERGAFVLHASAVNCKNNGILFTAPSGTGKTTQANLWVEHEGAEILNGDRTGIRFIDGKWYASGLPYDGSSKKFSSKMIPLRGIIVLRQGPENVIEALKASTSFKWILSESAIYYWDKHSAAKAVDSIRKLVTDIPIYIMHCRPDKGAVETVKNVLLGEKQ